MKYVSLFAPLCVALVLFSSCRKDENFGTPEATIEIKHFKATVIDVEATDQFRLVVTIDNTDPQSYYYVIRENGFQEPFDPTDTIRMLPGEQIAMDATGNAEFEQTEIIDPSVVIKSVWYRDYDRDYGMGFCSSHIYYLKNLHWSIIRDGEIMELPSGFCPGPPLYKKGMFLKDGDILKSGDIEIKITRAPSINPNWGAVGIFVAS